MFLCSYECARILLAKKGQNKRTQWCRRVFDLRFFLPARRDSGGNQVPLVKQPLEAHADAAQFTEVFARKCDERLVAAIFDDTAAKRLEKKKHVNYQQQIRNMFLKIQSDHFQISPATSPWILHHTARKT